MFVVGAGKSVQKDSGLSRVTPANPYKHIDERMHRMAAYWWSRPLAVHQSALVDDRSWTARSAQQWQRGEVHQKAGRRNP